MWGGQKRGTGTLWRGKGVLVISEVRVVEIGVYGGHWCSVNYLPVYALLSALLLLSAGALVLMLGRRSHPLTEQQNN